MSATLYHVAAGLLTLALLGHTLGGMLGTARRGPQAGERADHVLAEMRSVHFTWRGANSSWYAWWLGNGLGVSCLLILGIAVLWFLGGLAPDQRHAAQPLAWAAFASLALLGVTGIKYFGARIGGIFTLIALLTGVAAAL
jgi:hypothetical protein